MGRHSLGKTKRWNLGILPVVATTVVLLVAASIAIETGDVAGRDEPGRSHQEGRGHAEPPPPAAAPINTTIEGLTTFRGNATRSYYGTGPVPSHPSVLWEYPEDHGLCSTSVDQKGERLWCGTGWTGQPNVVELPDGDVEVRFGAYDGAVHVLNASTGRPVLDPFQTGDLIKGTVTSDPDGLPLLYTGSRDNYLRVLALDRGPAPVELWSLSSDSAPEPVWNNDWDGSPLVVDDLLIEGGENSWFYVIKLNRGHDDRGRVTVDPKVKAVVPGFDERLFADLGDDDVSIENSVALYDEVVYFANSGGLVQGWDIGAVFDGGRRIHRTFRFWTGDDTDASIVIDDEGFLYVASELERFNDRALGLGQLMKLNPRHPKNPLVWSLPVPGEGGSGGLWATPALHGAALFAPTNSGRLLAVNRHSGKIAWEMRLPGPLWSSPAVVDNTLIVGDCSGVLHAYDVGDSLDGPPRELWTVSLPGCIESTPAVWKGMIYVGTRAGKVYGIGDR